MLISQPFFRPFFTGKTLNRNTPVYVAEGDSYLAGRPATAAPMLPDSQENLVLPPETTRD